MTRLVLVLWSGNVGGAEIFGGALAAAIRRRGVEAGVLFATESGLLAAQLDADGIPWRALELRRGAEVLLHPRRLATGAGDIGPDGAITASAGYLPAALRLGGYRGRIAAVNHGRILQLQTLSGGRRLLRRADRASGFWAADVEVAVSDFMLERLRQERFRARELVRIHNGIDLDRFRPPADGGRGPFVVGWAGRLVPGKGVDDLLRAFARVRAERNAELRIAGDGPERPGLEALAGTLGLQGAVDFAGWTSSVSAFWSGCDVAAVPSNQYVESFGMAGIEAMACARPVVASRNGALPEIVADGATGRIVAPGDVEGLAAALLGYAADPEARRRHGEAARARCESRFGIDGCADAYLGLFANGRGAA